MKSIAFATVLSLQLAACGGAPTPLATSSGEDFATPQGTFATLVAAVRARDLDTYARCFAAGSAESEGMVSRIRKQPERNWRELQGIFRGAQTLSVELDGDTARGQVDAPEAEQGGIGSIRFVRGRRPLAGEQLVGPGPYAAASDSRTCWARILVRSSGELVNLPISV